MFTLPAEHARRVSGVDTAICSTTCPRCRAQFHRALAAAAFYLLIPLIALIVLLST